MSEHLYKEDNASAPRTAKFDFLMHTLFLGLIFF